MAKHRKPIRSTSRRLPGQAKLTESAGRLRCTEAPKPLRYWLQVPWVLGRSPGPAGLYGARKGLYAAPMGIPPCWRRSRLRDGCRRRAGSGSQAVDLVVFGERAVRHRLEGQRTGLLGEQLGSSFTQGFTHLVRRAAEPLSLEKDADALEQLGLAARPRNRPLTREALGPRPSSRSPGTCSVPALCRAGRQGGS